MPTARTAAGCSWRRYRWRWLGLVVGMVLRGWNGRTEWMPGWSSVRPCRPRWQHNAAAALAAGRAGWRALVTAEGESDAGEWLLGAGSSGKGEKGKRDKGRCGDGFYGIRMAGSSPGETESGWQLVGSGAPTWRKWRPGFAGKVGIVVGKVGGIPAHAREGVRRCGKSGGVGGFWRPLRQRSCRPEVGDGADLWAPTVGVKLHS